MGLYARSRHTPTLKQAGEFAVLAGGSPSSGTGFGRRHHTRFPFLGSSNDELPGYALGLASNGTRTPHPIKAVAAGTKVEIIDRSRR